MMKKNIESIELAKLIRKSVLMMTSLGMSSHVGSCLSIADIVAVLYSDELHIDANDPHKYDRDRLILSKGHAGAALYSALAYKGFFSEKILSTHYQNGSFLSGHVSHKEIPGVEISTGSLGHGLSIGCGFAYGSKIAKENWRTYVIISDGECNEGSVWEAALFAGHHKLSNLCVLLDYNKLQSIKSTKETLDLEPIEDKWLSFGWDVERTSGHDHVSLNKSLNNLKLSSKPGIIICDTIKGKGVSFMENKVLWHYKSPSESDLAQAIKEIDKDER